MLTMTPMITTTIRISAIIHAYPSFWGRVSSPAGWTLSSCSTEELDVLSLLGATSPLQPCSEAPNCDRPHNKKYSISLKWVGTYADAVREMFALAPYQIAQLSACESNAQIQFPVWKLLTQEIFEKFGAYRAHGLKFTGKQTPIFNLYRK